MAKGHLVVDIRIKWWGLIPGVIPVLRKFGMACKAITVSKPYTNLIPYFSVTGKGKIHYSDNPESLSEYCRPQWRSNQFYYIPTHEERFELIRSTRLEF